jgi:hypothetical protein
VPSLAFITPPLTGASSISTPASASFSAIMRVEDGLELDVSIRTIPGVSCPASPSSPNTTFSTTVEFGRDRSTISATEASASGLVVGTAAVSSSRAVASSSAS